MFFHPRVPNNPSQQLRSLRASRFCNTTVTLLFLVINIVTAVDSSSVVPCPTGTSVSVTMATHFQGSSAIFFQQCDFVHEVFLANTLSNVNISFVGCVFHKGNGSIRFDPSGTFTNVVVEVSNSTVVHWWLIMSSSGGLAVIEDTSPVSDSLFIVGGATSGLPYLSGVSVLVSQLLWTAACVNRSSNLYGTNAIGLPSYFTAGAWRSVDSQGFTGEMQHWAPSLWYATGTATVVTLTIVLSGVQTIALVGSVAAELSAITSGSSQASLNVAIDACAGLPIVAHVHLVAFELSTTLIASSVTIQSSVLQFGNPGYAASGVLPGASASLIRVQPLGSTPSDNLVRNAAFSVSSTNVTIAVVPAPRVSLVGNVDIPDGVTPRWRRNVTVGGASLAATVLPAPIVPSPLVSTVGGVKLIGSIDGYSRTALASNTVSIAVTNSFFRAGPALSTMDSVSISAGWLNNSIVAQGVDVVSSWIHLSRLPQLVAATIFMTNATMEATGVDRSWMELAASAMNTTATHPFYQNVWNDADVIMRASSSQIGVASAAGWAFSVFAHTVVIAEFGSGGLMHSSITISGSQCRCSDRCHAVNITGGISMLGHRQVGRVSADVLVNRTDSKLTNVTIAFDAFTFRSRVASKAVTLSTYCATFLRLGDKTSPTAPCASVSHRLTHFAEELLLDTISNIRLTIDASVVSIFEPMTSTAERSTVLTNAALQAFMFPPQGTAYQRQGVWPALLQITAYRMYNFYFRLGSCSVDAGWGHDVTLMFQQNVDPSRSSALVESTTLTLLNTTITHRGWQTRAVAWMSPSTSLCQESVTAASSARTVVVQGSTSGASKDAQGLQVLWTSTTVAQTITPLQIASTMLNITNMSGIMSAVTFATAAVYYANLSFGDGGILMTSSTVTVAAVDPTTTLRGWAVDGSLAVIITSNATFLSTSNFASEDGVTLTLVQAPTSMEMMSIGVFADSVLLSDGAPFSLTRTTIKGISMGAVFTRTTFSNAQFFVSSVSTIAAACEVYPDRAIGVASSIWSNSNKTGDSFWTQCAATMFVANTSFLSGSAIWLDSSTLSTTILLASSTVATSCYVVPTALDSIVVHGTWVTSQIVIRRSSVVVDGRGSLSSPRPTGIIIVSSSSAIRTWRLVSGNTTTSVGGNATLWNTTTITISTSSTIAIDSSFGPAVCLQLLYATVYRSSFQVNTASTITVTSTSRLPSKTGTVTHYTTGSALCPNVVSGFANSSYLDAQLDSIRRVVLSSSNATATRNGAAYLYCGRRCVIAQLENRFDSSFLTVITALDPPVPALDMGWLVPSTTTPANNISVPIPMVNFLVQRRRAALVHFGTGGSVISGDPDDNVTIAFGVSVLFMKSTVITMCEVQPVAAYGRLYDITTDVGDVLNPLQCRSVGVLLEQPTQLFAFELRVDGSTMRSTVQSSVITTSVARNTLADPDSQAALQRAQILLQTAQIMNMTSAEAYGCRHLVNGVAIMSAAWMYMPAKALIRWHAFNASASAKPEDFFSDSVAATFIWGTGVVVLQRPVNASVLWSAMPILSLSDANAVVSAWSYVAETQPLNITITSQSTVVASSSTIAEGCSAANIHFQGSTAIDGLFVNVSGSSVLRAALYIIPVLRVNATANALTSAEESSCVAVAQSSANANNDRSYNNAFTSLSALEKEEPVAVNLLFHNVTLTSTTISILDTTITAFVSPVFTISTELTMAGAWFYESRFPRLTGAAAVNGSYMMHRALSRHACNIRFDGTYKTSSWNSFEVNRGPSSAAQLSMTARIFSGIDGKAQNIVFSGLGSWRDASNLWSFASLAALPLTAVGSPRTFPVMKEALLLGVPLASMLSGNVLIDRTFNTSNQTLSIGGAALTCGGHCTNIALGSTISSATTTLSPWLGTRISITGTSFLSQALLSEFQPPLSGVNSDSGVILTISSGVFSAANRVTVYLSIGRLAQTRQRVSHNVILGTVGPESQVAIQGASFVSSGVNVGIINAALSTVQISITSLSGFWSGCWAGSQSVDSSGTSYVALGRDVASSRPCLPTVSTCPTSSGPQSINSTTPDSTLEPSVGNLLICKSNITRSSVVQLRVPQASPTFTAAVVIPSNWSNSDSTLIAAKNVLVVDSYLGQSSSLTISPVTPSTTTLQLIANVSMPRVSSPNSTVFATSLWWSSATNIEFVNVTVDNARVAFSASTMLIRSYAAVSADGILMTVATSHNIRLVRSTWSCGGTTTSCIQLPSSTSRSDVVQAATSTLVTRNVLFGSLYQVGFSLNGIQELSSFSSAVNNSISLNVIVEDNTWSTAMFYASSALAPTAVVSSPSAFMSATVQGMNALSKAANVAVTGSTAFVNTSVVMLQGFGDVSASYFPLESNTSSLWTTLLPLSGIYIPFAIVPLCTSVEIASVLFPTVNMFVGQNTTISNARFEYSNTLMTTNSSNMQCMSSNIANMTVSLYQSTWSASITPAAASPQQLQGANVWNVALAANSGDIGTINFIVEQSSKLIAVSVGGGNAFNIAVDVTISGLNSEACLSPIVPLTLSVTDGSGLSAISSQNATASNLWVNACMNLSTATAAFKPSSSVITLNVLRNSYVESNAAGGGALSSSSSSQMNGISSIDASSALNVFVRGNVSSQLFTVNVTVSDSSRATATGGAVAQVILIRSSHTNQKAGVATPTRKHFSQCSRHSVAATSTRYAGVVEQHYLQQSNNTMYANVMINTSITVSTSSSIRCTVTNTITDEAGASIPRPYWRAAGLLDRMQWPALLHEDNSAVRVLQQYSDVLSSSTSISSLVNVLVTGDSAVMSTLTVSDTRLADRGGLLAGYSIFSKSTTTATLTNIVRQWRSGVSHSAVANVSVTSSNGARIHVNNSIAAASSSTSQRRNDTALPSTCALAARNKLAADLLARSVRYSTSVIDVLDVIPATSVTPTLAARQTSATVSIDSSSTVASMHNGARIHVNNSIAAASSSTSQRRNDTALPSTCALAARNKLAADLLARSVRYSTSVIDVLDVIPATSVTPTLAARQTSATVSIDSSSTVASMTSMIFPTYNQSASMVTIAAAVDVSLVRAPYTAFSPSSNLTSVGMSQIPLGTQPPVIVATIDDIQVNVHVSRGSLLTIVVSSGAPQEPSSGVLPIGCSRPVFSVGRASVWRRVVSIVPGALVYANTSDLVFATTVAAASYVSATAPNSCAVTAWALPQWWFQSGNISSLRCSLNVSGGGIRLGESKVPSSVCAIAPLIIAAFAVDGSDRFANVSVPLTPVSQSATQSSAQQHRALNVLSIGGPIYTTGVARNKSMISVSLSNQASLIISQESTMTPPNSNTLPFSHSAVVSMTDVPESGSVVLNAEGQSVVTLTHPVSLGASTSNDLIIRLPPLALLSFKSVGSTISNITLTASDQSLLQGSGEIIGIALQGSSRCNIVNVVVQVSNRSRVSGAWSSLFSMDIDDIDTSVSVQRAQNISVSVDNAPYAGTFTMGVLIIPEAQAS
ncbi:GPI-anchored surface protein, putative, partial [Bodo saltans]